jgi:hypothetical protein
MVSITNTGIAFLFCMSVCVDGRKRMLITLMRNLHISIIGGQRGKTIIDD